MLKFFPQKTPVPRPQSAPTPVPVPEPLAEPEHEAAAQEYDADPAAHAVEYDSQQDPLAAEAEYVEEAPVEAEPAPLPVAATPAPTLPTRSAMTPPPPAAPASVRERAASFFQDKPKVPEKAPVMPENPNKNILSKDVEIKGNIKFTNELIIDGKIEGEISSDGILTVGENADIRGEIKTKSVTVLGKVNGNITVSERCELKARAHLVGDLKAARLVIEEGATFVGKSEVTLNKGTLPNKGVTTTTPAPSANVPVPNTAPKTEDAPAPAAPAFTGGR